MQWYNAPPEWSEDGDGITVKAAGDTDFWRLTKHGFIADNGHFYYQEVIGGFTAEVKITGDYAALYDQSGLMVRESELVWMKCGIEYLDGVQQASTVITRDFSDWSVLPLHQAPKFIWIRVQRTKETIEVFYSLDGESYTMLREAYLTETPALQVGIMTCAPKGDGFSTNFEGFKVTTVKA